MFLEASGPANKFHNVYILRDQMETVWCVNCHSDVGGYDEAKKIVMLIGVVVRKVALTKFRTQCVQQKRRARHSHRYRVWQAVTSVRKIIDFKRISYGTRGKKRMPCPSASSFCTIGFEERKVRMSTQK